VLIIMCVVFVLTHIPRLILAFEAFFRAASMSTCMENGNYTPPLALVCLESVSNLLILVFLPRKCINRYAYV